MTYQLIIDLLTQAIEEGLQVSDVLNSVLDLCDTEDNQSSVRRDADGNVTEIFCWFHKNGKFSVSTLMIKINPVILAIIQHVNEVSGSGQKQERKVV